MPLSRRQAIQALMSMPAVASIETLRLEENDILVVQCNEILSDSTIKKIEAQMQLVFPGQRCAVFDSRATLKVVKG